VYFKNGVPVATTHTLAKSVPADAVFTDTITTVNGKSGAIDREIIALINQ
jgi:hypothetical protein